MSCARKFNTYVAESAPEAEKTLDLEAPDAVTRRPPTKHASITPTSELQPASANLLVKFPKKHLSQAMIAAAEPGTLPTS